MGKRTIVVAGVRFSAEQVKEAIVTIDGRDVHIKREKRSQEPKVPRIPSSGSGKIH